MRIDFLDVGDQKYGDCVLVRRGRHRILIDGGHLGDSTLIRRQLSQLLDQRPPFHIDLLVVTHCHSDHIGCLPSLVESGELTADYALVADEGLGFRELSDGAGSPGGRDAIAHALAVALQEEDRSDVPPADLDQFLADVMTLQQRYVAMLARLDQQGTEVIRYGRDSMARVRQVEQSLQGVGLRVLGPTPQHLQICADLIDQATDSLFAELEAAASGAADTATLASLYRRLASRSASDAEFAADRPGPGAAKNDQSIVLSVTGDGWSALLAGDMQFAAAEVPGLGSEMRTLRREVVQAGPFDLVKLSHHTSYNGFDASLLEEWPATTLFVHTGGRNDRTHPDHGALRVLRANAGRILFGRTDRNKLVSVEESAGQLWMTAEEGRLNDFRPNRDSDVVGPTVPIVAERDLAVRREVDRPAAPEAGVVEVTARVPHTATQVTLTIRVEPQSPPEGAAISVPPGGRSRQPPVGNSGGARSASVPLRPAQPVKAAKSPSDIPGVRLGGGRPLPRLLFVTCRPRLESNIGRLEAAKAVEALRQPPSAGLVELSPSTSNAEQAAEQVRAELRKGDYDGVVIVGGYDVVPAHRLDVLDAEARQRLRSEGTVGRDADDFVVWSDEIYGDRDADLIPELPVSRIPDGRQSEVVFAALQAPVTEPGPRFAVRNLARPFAEAVFKLLPGTGGRIEVSESYCPADVPPGAAAGAVYYMLHGADYDATRFWGETPAGSAYEAFRVDCVPKETPGSIVFTGCCWGALPATPIARSARPQSVLHPRDAENSIAIAYLRGGALAFVGCTGSHYSPIFEPLDYFGKPMHDAFWKAVGQGIPPAPALFLAKQEYVLGMPHGRTDNFSRAVEMKLLRQFTCLGLGW